MTAVNSTPVNQRAATGAKRGEVEVLVIGAGQAGLGTGYWLSRRSAHSLLIVDERSQLGQSWTDRWDSLRLFTPRGLSRLPGLPFPAGPGDYPSKSEVASYLASRHRRARRPGTSAVLWCTGFRPDYRWMQVSGALDADGLPIHDGGESPVPGLHWIRLRAWMPTVAASAPPESRDSSRPSCQSMSNPARPARGRRRGCGYAAVS